MNELDPVISVVRLITAPFALVAAVYLVWLSFNRDPAFWQRFKNTFPLGESWSINRFRLLSGITAIAIVLFVLLPSVTPLMKSTTSKPERRIIRTNAGEPEADGWYTARSEYGLFSVRLPLQFNEGIVSDENSTQYVIAINTTDGVEFGVVKVVRTVSEPEKEIKTFLASKGGSAFTKGTVSEEKVFNYQGFPAAEFRADNGTRTLWLRTLIGKDFIFILRLEHPQEQQEVSQLKQPFMDSLKVDQ